MNMRSIENRLLLKGRKNKKTIITLLLVLVAMAGQAQTFTIAVGTGTWGIAAVIPKYLSLRLPCGDCHISSK